MAIRKKKKKLNNIDPRMGYKTAGYKSSKPSISSITQRWMTAVIIWGAAILIALSLFEQAGLIGKYILLALNEILGWGRYIIPIVFFASGYWIAFPGKIAHPYYKVTGIFIALLSLLALTSIISGGSKMDITAAKVSGGGYIGVAIAYPLVSFLSIWGGAAICATLLLVGMVLMLDGHFSKKELKMKLLGSEEEDIREEKVEVKPIAQEKLPLPEKPKVEEKPEKIEQKSVNLLSTIKGWRKKIGNIKSEKDDSPKQNITTQAENVSLNEEPDINQQDAQNKVPVNNQVQTNSIAHKNDDWKLPPLGILEKNKSKAVAEDIKTNSAAIKSTLSNFGIPVEVADVNVGPTVTQYALRPAEGIKLSRITALHNDLAMSLAAHPIRIEAPIPGRSLVGVEVPNKVKRVVSLRELLESPTFHESDERLLIAFGEDSAGNYVYSDLAEMPHLLIAGATGSGKSIGINCLITSLLYRNSPKQLKLILVDPKRVELSSYNDIPHLLTPVIVDPPKVVNALKWAVSEMERRYILIQETMSRNIGSYNQKIINGEVEPDVNPQTGEIIEPEQLPYIVFLIDELADLMSSSFNKEIEATVVRLAQMSRAVGIHLVLSTQRPSVNVITGIIKANFPTRVAFQVVSQIDSRTILDMSGAEKLLGKGDMLYLARESNQPRRIQGAYISEKEVQKMTSHIRNQEVAIYDPSVVRPSSGGGSGSEANEDMEEDDLYSEAKRIVTKESKASTSLLQRHLRIGYARAARLMDILERNGIIGPAEGSKPRQVLSPSESQETNYENPLEDQAKRDNWSVGP